MQAVARTSIYDRGIWACRGPWKREEATDGDHRLFGDDCYWFCVMCILIFFNLIHLMARNFFFIELRHACLFTGSVYCFASLFRASHRPRCLGQPAACWLGLREGRMLWHDLGVINKNSGDHPDIEKFYRRVKWDKQGLCRDSWAAFCTWTSNNTLSFRKSLLIHQTLMSW